jgi:endonuclease/exonuclease/phosphatase family metal-dependent hydrolase
MRTLLFAIGAALAPLAHAFEVTEFDSGFAEWTPTPQLVGQSTTPGWEIRDINGDLAACTNPATTLYTYYWRLTRDIDLTTASGSSLDVGLSFVGAPYESVRIEIGPQGSTRNADFVALWEGTTTTPLTDLDLPLQAWEGRPATLRVVLKKGHNVNSSASGMCLHHIGVVLPPPPPPPPDPVILNVGSFNVQVFGLSKMGTPGVPEALVSTMSRYDLLLFQEIRDKSGVSFTTLMTQLNAATDNAYEAALSPRLGRTTSKEQYAFVYRVDKLDLIDQAVWPDPTDEFEREPYVARFETVEGGNTFTAIGLHAAPGDVVDELTALSAVYDDVVGTYDEEDILMMGDFNAGCSYLSANQYNTLDLATDPTFSWQITGAADTTTTSTVCPYDRAITTGGLSEFAVEGSAVPFWFDQALGLGPETTKSVSDHYPIEMLLDFGSPPPASR